MRSLGGCTGETPLRASPAKYNLALPVTPLRASPAEYNSALRRGEAPLVGGVVLCCRLGGEELVEFGEAAVVVGLVDDFFGGLEVVGDGWLVLIQRLVGAGAEEFRHG